VPCVQARGPFLREVAKERSEVTSQSLNFKNRTIAKNARMRVVTQFGSEADEHLPAPRTGGLYKNNCHQQGRFCRGLSVPCSSGRRGHVSFQNESPLGCGTRTSYALKGCPTRLMLRFSGRVRRWRGIRCCPRSRHSLPWPTLLRRLAKLLRGRCALCLSFP
jgi:hypothetical protein